MFTRQAQKDRNPVQPTQRRTAYLDDQSKERFLPQFISANFATRRDPTLCHEDYGHCYEAISWCWPESVATDNDSSLPQADHEDDSPRFQQPLTQLPKSSWVRKQAVMGAELTTHPMVDSLTNDLSLRLEGDGVKGQLRDKMHIWRLGYIISEVALFLTVGVGSSYLAMAYDKGGSLENLDPIEGTSRFPMCTLTIACCAFAVNSAWFYYRRRNHRHQDLFLLAGNLSGACAGILLGLDLQGIMFSILPWTVFIALALSACVHAFNPHWVSPSEELVTEDLPSLEQQFTPSTAIGDEKQEMK